MKYFFFKVAVALKLIESFQSQSCTRNSEFRMRIDDHYDDTILSAQVDSPGFLEVTGRSISRQNLASLHSTFPITIKAMSYISDSPVILDSQSLVFFNLSSFWNTSIIQHYMHPVIQNYSSLSVGKLIILYNSNSLAVFTNDRRYPILISEYIPGGNITFIVQFEDLILISENESLKILEIEDRDLGSFITSDFLLPEILNLTQFQVKEMWTDDFYLYILDDALGLARFFIKPLEFDKVFDLYGEKIAGWKDSIVIDGKFLLDTKTFQIFSYQPDRKCEFLSLDTNFIYCGSGDEILFISRVLNLNKTLTFRPIKAIVSRNSELLTAFKDSVSVDEIDLSPLFVSGKAPGEVSDYSVKFQVFGVEGQGDKQVFTLKVLYTLTDVILFIVFCLGIVFFIVGGTIVAYKCLMRNKEVQPPRPSVVPQESMNAETIRNPFSERRLVDRTQSLN
jgi:hypothetical protein